MLRTWLALLALAGAFVVVPGAVISQSARGSCIVTAYTPVDQGWRLVSETLVVCSSTADREIEMTQSAGTRMLGWGTGWGVILEDEPTCQGLWSTLVVGVDAPPYTSTIRVIEDGVTVAEATARTGEPGDAVDTSKDVLELLRARRWNVAACLTMLEDLTKTG